jgi:hypothetical protein
LLDDRRIRILIRYCTNRSGSATLVLYVVLQNHVKKTMEKGLYQLEDGELVPEPTLETKYDISSFLPFS